MLSGCLLGVPGLLLLMVMLLLLLLLWLLLLLQLRWWWCRQLLADLLGGFGSSGVRLTVELVADRKVA